MIGSVYVDAGIVMIGDPCYTLPDDGSHRDEAARDWHTFCDSLYGDDRDTLHGVEPMGQGVGIVVQSGYGDGEYPVVAEYEDGRVKSVTVKFF